MRGAIEMLNDADIDYTVCVDPEDVAEYKSQFRIRNVAVLDKSLAYNEGVRQISIANGDKWHWQINDDIYGFSYRRPGKKTTQISVADAITAIEYEVLRYRNIGLAGPEEDIWPPTKDEVKVNALPAQMLLINNSVKAKFEPFRGFEDINFMLQVFEQGFCTLKVDSIRIKASTPGTNKGGAFDAKRDQQLKRLVARWPKVVFNPGGSPGGRPNRKWIMKTFIQRPIPTKPQQFKLEQEYANILKAD